MKTPLLYTAAIIALFLGSNSQANVIDLFEDPTIQGVEVSSLNSSETAADYDENNSAETTIIGGYRDLDVQVVAIGPPQTTGGTTMVVSGGVLNFNTDSGVNAVGTVQWDGMDSDGSLDTSSDAGRALNTTGLGGVDLVNQEGCPTGGCDRFEFLIYNSDAGGDASWNFTIGLWTNDDTYTEFDLIATPVDNDPDGILSVLLFSDFTSTDGCNDTNTIYGGGFDFGNDAVVSKRCGTTGPVDVTSLGAIELQFNVATDASGAAVNIDLTIGGITKTGTGVPEPGILGLMGLSLAALGLVRIRGRKGKS